MMSSRYTVLGASGFVGSRVVSLLRELGIDCYAPNKGNADVLNRDLGSVFYCVGMTADYSKDPEGTVNAHVVYLSNIIKRAKFDRIVYLSSARLYDGLEDGVATEDTRLVYDTTNPRHLYDLSKALGENLTLNSTQGRGSVARLSCVYDSTVGAPGFMSMVLQELEKTKSLSLDSYSGFQRDYIFLDDVVSSLKAILDSGKNEVFNVASGQNVSNGELAILLQGFGYSVQISKLSEKQLVAVCDVSKIKELGVSPVLLGDFLAQRLGEGR